MGNCASKPGVKDDSTVFHAVETGDTKLLGDAITAANVNATQVDGSTSLILAAKSGELPSLELLCTSGAKLEEKDSVLGWTALMAAVQGGHIACVQALLDRRADVDTKDATGWTALMVAARRKDQQCVRALLNAGATVDSTDARGSSAMESAAQGGSLAILRLLIAHGGNVNISRANGFTPLMAAAIKGHTGCVEALVENGAEVDVVRSDGASPLMFSSLNGHFGCVRILVAKTAEIDRRDFDGRTALMCATSKGHFDCAKALIASGADVSTADKAGWTALMFAACNVNSGLVSLLVEAGADVHATANDEKTALDIALTARNMKDAEYLAQKMEEMPYGASKQLEIGEDIPDQEFSLQFPPSTGDNNGFVAMESPFAFASKATSLPLSTIEETEAHFLKTGTARTDSEILAEEGTAVLFPPKVFENGNGNKHADDHNKNKNNNVAEETPHLAAFLASRKSTHPEAPEIDFLSYEPTPTSPLESLAPAVVTAAVVAPAAVLVPALVFAAAGNGNGHAHVNGDAHVNGNGNGAVEFFSEEEDDEEEYIPAEVADLRWAIPSTDIALGSKLATASDSDADAYTATYNGANVSVKRVLLGSDVKTGAIPKFSGAQLVRIKTDADQLVTIKHNHIIPFLGVSVNPPSIVAEIGSDRSLFTLLQRAKTDPSLAAELSWFRRLRMAADAAAGMLYLHTRSPAVVHRGLRSSSLLVDSSWRVRISDLGLGRLEEEAALASGTGVDPRWIAGEVLDGQEWTLASDVYSFGVILWELLTWDLPWSHLEKESAIASAVRNGEILSIPNPSELPGPKPRFTEALKRVTELILKCTDRDPSARPRFRAALNELKDLCITEKILMHAEVQYDAEQYSQTYS